MISHKKYLLVFLIIFTHISLLDLFFVTLKGPVFLIEENLRSSTFFTHFFIAFSSLIVCWLTVQFRQAYKSGKLKLHDNVLMLCSLCLAASIYLVLF